MGELQLFPEIMWTHANQSDNSLSKPKDITLDELQRILSRSAAAYAWSSEPSIVLRVYAFGTERY